MRPKRKLKEQWFVKTLPVARGQILPLTGVLEPSIVKILKIGVFPAFFTDTDGEYLGTAQICLSNKRVLVSLPISQDYQRDTNGNPNRRKIGLYTLNRKIDSSSSFFTLVGSPVGKTSYIIKLIFKAQVQC